MPTLVVGASGATGQHLVTQLLDRDESVKIVVRSRAKLPDMIKNHPRAAMRLTIVEASLLSLKDEEMRQLVSGCTSICSCLGHNLTFQGMFGHPRDLVTQATKRLCAAAAAEAQKDDQRVKFLLMNTAGNVNHAEKEKPLFFSRCVVGVLRYCLPPHNDNEQAAAFLQSQIGTKHPSIEWVVVRPDGLIDEPKPSPWEVHPSPTRDAITDSGTTTRANVAEFMAIMAAAPSGGTAADAAASSPLFEKWKGRMPVIYNKGFATPSPPAPWYRRPLVWIGVFLSAVLVYSCRGSFLR